MSRENDKEEAAVLAAIMALVNDQLSTIEYMLAENAAGRADREERDRHGESSGLLQDLRGYRENVLDEARDLARSIVALRREVRWMKDGTPATPGLFETLGSIFNPIRK
jgi:ribosomal protein L19E